MIEPAPKIPQTIDKKFFSLYERADIQEIIQNANNEYWYWSDLKYKPRPADVSAEDLWAVVKFSRFILRGFQWKKYGITLPITNRMQALCHYFDMNFGGSWDNSSIIPNDDRERYLISALMEEAISSSQMEGASTTRRVAKDMLRKKISPRSRSEQMIYNNYNSIRFIVDHKNEKLTKELILNIHFLMTQKTLDDENDAGKFRSNDDVVVENSITYEVVHTPPTYTDIPEFVDDLCNFVNAEDSSNEIFVHPILKAIFIHFLISYVHPFVDGNGRTARALFYWYMLKKGYWLTEYLSISRIIYKSKPSYEKSFQYAEADGKDIGYFVNYHLRVLDLAFKDLKNYIERKIIQKQNSVDFMKLGNINERQAVILSLVRDNPQIVITVKELESRFAVSHTTAKSDLDMLVNNQYLKRIPVNKVKSAYIKGDRFDEITKS
jgi:Fic family protein